MGAFEPKLNFFATGCQETALAGVLSSWANRWTGLGEIIIYIILFIQWGPLNPESFLI